MFFNLLSSLFSDYLKKRIGHEFFKIPIFQQSWNMFSPPPQSNAKFFYRIYEYKNNTINSTEWFDIMQALYDEKKSNWFIGATSSDLSYLLYNSIQDIEENLADCYSSDSLTIEVVNECNKNIFFGDSLIVKYIRKFHLHNKEFINADSLEIEYKLVEDYFPSYDNRKKDYYNLTNHTIESINRPISKIFP